MGIVNVTPDSFSDGGQFLGLEAAVAQGALEPTDTSALALVLQATWVGSTLYTSADAAIDQTATRAAIFEQVIGPYRRAAD